VDLSDCEKADFEGEEPAVGKTVTITGLSVYNNFPIQVGLFQTQPTENDRNPPIGGTASIQSGRATVTLYNNSTNFGPWNETGDYYVAFMIGEDVSKPEAAFVSDGRILFSGDNTSVDVSDFTQVEGETGEQPGPGGDDPGEEVYGFLTVNGLSGEFMVYIVTEAITANNIATIMEADPVAYGEANGSSAELKWYSGDGNGPYNILIASRAGGGSIKFQNGVAFVKGSGSVTWGSMTVANVASLSVGTLTINGSLGTNWAVYIVNGPIAGDIWTIWGSMSDYVAMAPGYSSGNGWMIFTIGANGGSFNPGGNYSIIYADADAEVLKYQNGVSFNSGNATINLSSMLDPNYDDFGGGGGGGGWEDPGTGGGTTPPGGGETGMTGNAARSLFRFVR
jgi:hypothetical protein